MRYYWQIYIEPKTCSAKKLNKNKTVQPGGFLCRNFYQCGANKESTNYRRNFAFQDFQGSIPYSRCKRHQQPNPKTLLMVLNLTRKFYMKIQSGRREAKVSEQKWTEQSQKRKASSEVSDRISTELKPRDVWCCELGIRILPLINFVMLMRIFEQVLMMKWKFCNVNVITLTAVRKPLLCSASQSKHQKWSSS